MFVNQLFTVSASVFFVFWYNFISSYYLEHVLRNNAFKAIKIDRFGFYLIITALLMLIAGFIFLLTKRLVSLFAECNREMNKVIWPSLSKLKKLLLGIVLFCASDSLIVTILDNAFYNLIQMLKNI